MPNEVTIAVTMSDETGPTKDKVKAGYVEWAAGFEPIPIRAADPIDEAWQAQVAADVKATDPGEVTVPVTADTEAVAAEVEAARAQVEAAVEPVVIPVEAEQSPTSFRPSYTPAPLFGEGGDPYAAARAQIAAQPLQVPVVAADPITDAWKAQLTASIKSISADAVKIPVGADTEAFYEQVQQQLAELVDVKANIPIDAANLPEFRAEVTEQARALSQMVHVVIDVDPNTTSLAELRANILAAADASQAEVKAQEALAAALEKSNASGSAKDMATLATAEQDAAAASEAAAKAQQAVAAGMAEASAAEDVAAASARGLGAAMGPLWMIMNVAQIAMMSFGSSSSSTATQVQDASQQIIQLGQSAGTAAQGLVAGNANVQGIAGDLRIAGSSATEFSQAFVTGVAEATTYTNRLANEQQNLAAKTMTVAQIGVPPNIIGMGRASGDATITVAALTDEINRNKEAYPQLSQSAREAVDRYNALKVSVPQAQDALRSLTAAADQQDATLAALGVHLSENQKLYENYGIAAQAAGKALMDAEAASTYLEDSIDKASIAAGQGAQQWVQLQAAVMSAGQQEENASHAIATAEQGVESARHSQQQAVSAVTAAQQGYTNAVYQEGQAQQAVTAARAAAEQQLISLKLQADSAGTSVDAANLSLFRATQAAALLGVNPNNAQAIAGEQITAANEAQVAAADALLQAEDQLAQAQNSSATAQSALNTARQQGVDNNPNVLSAEHALSQAQDAVTTSAQGVTNAQWAQQQAAIAVSNAQYGVAQAEQQLTAADTAYKAAVDASSRSTDQNTLAGAQNRQEIEKIYQAYQTATNSEQIAKDLTEQVGGAMHFTKGQIDDVIGSLQGLNGTHAKFGVEGTPSLNLAEIISDADRIGLAINSMFGGKASGGPGGGLTWVGEGGPELVDLPHGTEVITNANSMMMVASGEVMPPGHAVGGPVGASALDPMAAALAANFPLAIGWGAYDATAQAAHAMGGPPVTLPAAGSIDWGPFGGMLGSVPTGPSSAGLSGDRAANKAIMQQVFAQFGWGSGPQWEAQDYVEMREAGYNNYAQNPTSTAFGMGQFLDSTWGAYGFTKTADPYIQSEAMARYEGARYGGPIGAAAHEKAFNWYGGGGPASGVVGVGDRGPELARIPGRGGSGQAITVDVNLNFTGASDSGAASWFHGLVRQGAVQLSAVVNGQRVPVKVG